MTTNNFAPDKIFALGGGGKELAFTFLQEDWILEEIIRPRAANPEQLEVTILDTASGEQNADDTQIQEIEATCDSLTESFIEDGAGGTPGRVDIQSLLLTENIEMTSATTLTAPRAVEAYATAQGMNPADWWLQDGDVEEDLNFAKGVFRRRALAKATFYRAASERTDVENVIDSPEAGSIAIFVGLGGGSGAGILFDVIETIAAKSPTSELTVFGIIPSEIENSPGVHANAYATLCELETMRLSDDDPLENVVLYPLDPTGYSGKDGNLHDTEDALDEFDHVFTQSVIAYYNAPGEDPFNQTPAYAPFTVAVPQAIHYNASAFDTAQVHMQDYLDAYSEVLSIEREVTNVLSRYFAHQALTLEDATDLTDEDRAFLRTRIEEIVEVATEDLFVEMEFTASELFIDQYEDIRADESLEKDPLAFLRRLKEYLAPHAASTRDFKNDLDGQLLDVLIRSIDLLADWAALLQEKNAVVDSNLTSKLGDFTHWGETGWDKLADDVVWFQSRHERLEDKRATAEADLEAARQDLRNAQDAAQAAIETAVTTWEEDTTTARRGLTGHDIATLQDHVDTLQTELTTLANVVSTAASSDDLDAIDPGDVMEALDDIESYVDCAEPAEVPDRSIVSKTTFANAIETLIDARAVTLSLTEAPGILDRVLALGQGGVNDDEAAARRDYQDRKRDLERGGVFKLTGSPEEFGVRITNDGAAIVDKVADWQSQYRNTIVETANRVRPEHAEAIEGMGAETLIAAVTSSDDATATLTRLYESGDAPDADLDIDRLEADYAEVKTACERIEDTLEMAKILRATHQATYIDANADMREAEAAYENVRAHLAVDDEFDYRKTIQPANLIGGQQETDLASAGLLTDQTERNRFTQALDELVANVTRPQYNGLLERRPTTNAETYHGMNVHVGIVSPAARDIALKDCNVANRLSQAFAAARPGDRSDNVGVYEVTNDSGRAIGPAWDAGVHVFLSGVFLDNLRFVTGPGRDEYATSNRREQTPHIHHAYDLESGAYTHRTDHVNIRDPEEARLYVATDDHDVVDTIQTDYTASTRAHPEPSDHGADSDSTTVQGDGSASDTGDGVSPPRDDVPEADSATSTDD